MARTIRKLTAIDASYLYMETPEVSMEQLVKNEHHKSVQSFMDTEDIQFGYCTEFMVKFQEDKLKEKIF